MTAAAILWTTNECALASGWECRHGTHCSCRLLAAATGAECTSIDYGFCRAVLQKRWRMTCDHLAAEPRALAPISVPPHDSRDPVQAILVANADFVRE